jgi:SAM-dependent methyltransferase
MLVCPACAASLSPSLSCTGCDWQGSYREGVPVLLPHRELNDPVSVSYSDNYDRIARDDLDAKVMDERYIENLSTNFCNAIGGLAGAEVCDIGAGKGHLVRKLLARGAAAVVAVDISLPYLARLVGERGVSPVLANAEALPFAKHFDIVAATDILEHVLNPGSFLYCANRALRPGGTFHVRVPYRENLLSYSPHFGCPYRFVHLRTFDRQLLRQALEEAGFAVERMWLDGYMAGEARPFWQNGYLRQKLYLGFKAGSRRRGRNPADLTLRPHGLRPVFLRPTVIIATARKLHDLVPAAGGIGFHLA